MRTHRPTSGSAVVYHISIVYLNAVLKKALCPKFSLVLPVFVVYLHIPSHQAQKNKLRKRCVNISMHLREKKKKERK